MENAQTDNSAACGQSRSTVGLERKRFEAWAQDGFASDEANAIAWYVWQSAVEAEREACAKVCDELQVNKSADYYPGAAFDGACRTCSEAIRMRSNV